MLQDLYLGAAKNDKTGTPARSGGDIINKNFAYLKGLIGRQPYSVFKFVQKGYGNDNLEIDEIGDIFCGWSNDGNIRISEGEWLGGSLSDSDNFKALVQVSRD